MSFMSRRVLFCSLIINLRHALVAYVCAAACLTSHQFCSIAFADMAKSQAAAAGQPAGKAVAIHPPRATDAFYAKLLPALEVLVCLQ